MNKIILAALVLSGVASSAESMAKEYEIDCAKVRYTVRNLNRHLPEDRQLSVKCVESYDSLLWGAVKRNFRSNILLEAPIPLCGKAKYQYTESVKFPYGANIGASELAARAVQNILADHGILARVKGSGSHVGSMYSVTEVSFPYCEEN